MNWSSFSLGVYYVRLVLVFKTFAMTSLSIWGSSTALDLSFLRLKGSKLITFANKSSCFFNMIFTKIRGINLNWHLRPYWSSILEQWGLRICNGSSLCGLKWRLRAKLLSLSQRLFGSSMTESLEFPRWKTWDNLRWSWLKQRICWLWIIIHF